MNTNMGLPGLNPMSPPTIGAASATAVTCTTAAYTSSSAPANTVSMLVDDQSKKIQKPYTITKSKKSWTEQEHDKFLEAFQLFDHDWKNIEACIGSKIVIQTKIRKENSERKKVAVAFLAIRVIFSPETFGSKSDGGIIMFKNLSRNQFGNLQSKMFPVYFTMVGICLAVSAGSFGYLHPWSSSSVADKYQLDFLLSAFAFNLTNLFVFTPMTIEVIASY
ncbi:hypothetical protein ACFX15_031742 [Malus domestica]